MDISSVTAPSSLNTVAAIGAQPAVFPPSVPAGDTVNISAAGKLLSASTLFDAATNSTDFAAVAVTTQYFADAYNNFLQSDSLQSTTGGSLNSLFTQALNADTGVFRLSAIGINFLTPASGQITIDYNTLQAAYLANPAGTVSQLTQATLSIGQLAAQFTTLAAQLNSLSQMPLPAATSAAAPAQTAAPTATNTAATAATAATTSATATTAAATVSTTAPVTATALPIVTTTLPTNTTAQNPAPVSFVNPTVNSADPAIAAAIASYHMVDGIFDMAKPHNTGPAPKPLGYSEITTIAPIQPVILNLHA